MIVRPGDEFVVRSANNDLFAIQRNAEDEALFLAFDRASAEELRDLLVKEASRLSAETTY